MNNLTSDELQLETLKAEYKQYTEELQQLELSVEDEIDYRTMQIIVDEKLPAIRDRLTEIYSDILYLQERIALELKARRL
jgi:hypothetical protein